MPINVLHCDLYAQTVQVRCPYCGGSVLIGPMRVSELKEGLEAAIMCVSCSHRTDVAPGDVVLQGALHIRKSAIGKHTLTFSPDPGSGSVTTTHDFDAHDALEAFLEQIGIPLEHRRSALRDLRTTPQGTSVRIRLPVDQLKKLGLIE